MKKWVRTAVAIGAVALLGGGCMEVSTDTDTDTEMDVEGGAGMDEEGANGNIEASTKTSATLLEQNDSGESGGVVLTDENGKTRVTLTVSGQADGADQPAHVHTGSCATIGAVLFPLNNVVDGKSETVIDTSLADLLSATTALSVNVHMSPTDLGTYVACADIKAE